MCPHCSAPHSSTSRRTSPPRGGTANMPTLHAGKQVVSVVLQLIEQWPLVSDVFPHHRQQIRKRPDHLVRRREAGLQFSPTSVEYSRDVAPVRIAGHPGCCSDVETVLLRE